MTIQFRPSVLVLTLGAYALGCSGSGAVNSPTSSSAGGALAGGGGSGGTGLGGANTGVGTNNTGGATVTSSAQLTGGTTSIIGSTGGANAAGSTAVTGGSSSIASGGDSNGGGTGGSTSSTTGGASSIGGKSSTSSTGGASSATGGASSATGGASTLPVGGTSSGGSTGGGSTSTGISSNATSTIVGNGCTAPAQYANLFISLLGETQATSDAKIQAAWNQLYNPSNANTVFYNGPGTDESYVEDIADNVVRSEGQSYGMMTALQLNHQTEFDRLWTFVKNHMWKSGNTISWQTSTSGAVTGSGGAPDGDEWFAAALVFAHYRWGDTSGKYNYGTEAQKTLDLVRTTDFNQSLNLVRYYSGTDSNGTDASYMLPAFYQTWACFDATNAAFWNKALTATRAWLQTAAGTTGNVGDQSSFAGQTTNSGGDDKLRIVANFMSDLNFFNADPFETTYASEYATWVSSNNNGSTAMTACNGLLGFGLPATTGKPFVQKLWSAAIPTGNYRYYDGTLYMIGLLHVSGAFHLWYQ